MCGRVLKVKGINTPEGLEAWRAHGKCSVNFSCSSQGCSSKEMALGFEVPDKTPEYLGACFSLDRLMGLTQGFLPFRVPCSPSTDEEIGWDEVAMLEH